MMDKNRDGAKRLGDVKRPLVYSTGAIAKMFCVAPRTVTKWCDSGKLPYYRIPGSDDRRVTHANLARFLEDSGMPAEFLPGLTRPSLGVLVVTADADLVASLAALVSPMGVVGVSDWFAAGKALASSPWSAVVIDYAMGVGESSRALATAGVPAFALVTEDAPDPVGAVAFRHPLSTACVARLAAAVRKAAG